MNKEIKSTKLADLLRDRKKLIKKGYPHFDKIEDIVSNVITDNMKKIASDAEVWKYLNPYIDPAVYKEANGALAEEYRQIQKLEYEMVELKHKIKALVDKQDIVLEEFEEIGNVSLAKGKITVEIVDLIERYKELIREKRNEES